MKIKLAAILISVLSARAQCVLGTPFGFTRTATSGPAMGTVYPEILTHPLHAYIVAYGNDWGTIGNDNSWITGSTYPYPFGSLMRYVDDLNGSPLLDSVRSFYDQNGHVATNSIRFVDKIILNSSSTCPGCWIGTTLTTNIFSFPKVATTNAQKMSPQYIMTLVFAAGRKNGGLDFDPDGVYFFITSPDIPRWGTFFDVVNYNMSAWSFASPTFIVKLMASSQIDGLNFGPLLGQLVGSITSEGNGEFGTLTGWSQIFNDGCVNADPPFAGNPGNMCLRDSRTVVLGGNSYPTVAVASNALVNGASNMVCGVSILQNR